MKKLLLVLFLTGCSSYYSTTNDAGVVEHSSLFIEAKAKMIKTMYYPKCVMLCEKHTGDIDCADRCTEDFDKINKVLRRAIKENKVEDFDDMMDSWYGVWD